MSREQPHEIIHAKGCGTEDECEEARKGEGRDGLREGNGQRRIESFRQDGEGGHGKKAAI